MFLQKKDNVFDIEWGGGKTYGDVRMRDEVEQSKYAFNQDTGISRERFSSFHRSQFDENFKFGEELMKGGLLLPALEHCLKLLAPVQPARLERQRRRHRAHGLHPARAPTRRSPSAKNTRRQQELEPVARVQS